MVPPPALTAIWPPVASHDDATLASRLKAGSECALAEIYERHAPAVIAQARATLGNAHAAEDVAQDVFTSLWRNSHRFDPARGSLRSYLLALARHRAIDLWRAEHARTRRQERFVEHDPVAPGVEDTVAATDQAEQMRASLDALPRDQRRAIDLAFFGRHSYREVAELLAEPEGTIKSRIRAGLVRLRTEHLALADVL